MQGKQGQLKEVWAVLGQRALYLAWLPQGPENTLMTGFQDCNEKDTHTCTHTRAAPVHKHKKLCIIVTGYPTYVFQGLEMTGEALDQVAAITESRLCDSTATRSPEWKDDVNQGGKQHLKGGIGHSEPNF